MPEYIPDGMLYNPKKSNYYSLYIKRLFIERDFRGKGAGKSYEKTLGVHTHRVVAAQMLGRNLLPGEVVHHIDGDIRNNRPENLMVFSSQAEHAKWHKEHEGGDAK